LAGLEKLTAIPGTVGGAIVGNAGAYGQAISDHLVWVEIFDGHKIRQVKKTALQFSYRDSLFKRRPDWLVLRAAWALPAGERKLLQAESRKIRTIRLGKYPSGILCAGSFFKNLPVSKVPKKVLKTIPPEKIVNGKIPAGYLLEQVHSGQMSVGGMAVASFHNNFLINTGFGTYYDLRRLANRLKTKVRKRFGLELEEEIRYIA
jgi:UDP-N-acetylmuramate dehydrogenase